MLFYFYIGVFTFNSQYQLNQNNENLTSIEGLFPHLVKSPDKLTIFESISHNFHIFRIKIH